MRPVSTQPAAPATAPRVMPARDARLRLNDFYEVYEKADPATARQEGARCMNCGAAFCVPDSGYGAGCPIHNKIPEWNELVRLNRWRDAYDRLSTTNPFPEFTSRICPAPCQDACIVGINENPIQIKGIERAIIDRAFDAGWVRPIERAGDTGKRIAIIGSGPAGLAAADRLNRHGHRVSVYERSDRFGGLLMYGVPNMKLDKALVDRRVRLLEYSGVTFHANCDLGVDVDPMQLAAEQDATLLAVGALQARDLDIPGRELTGVHMAMDYLTGSTRMLRGDRLVEAPIDAAGKDVIVIGGGDTGADCIGTALRQRCRSLLNLTRREQPPLVRPADHLWPGPTGTYTLDYAHSEGKATLGRDPREFEVEPVALLPDHAGQRVAGVRVRRLDTGQLEDLTAQLVILAIGFTGTDAHPLVKSLDLPHNHGRIITNNHRCPRPGIYAAGDCSRGPSLIVWAIREGVDATQAIHSDLVTCA